MREGRREEFAAFHTVADVPDPQDPATFERSRLNRALRQNGSHRLLYQFYRELTRLRRALFPIIFAQRETMRVIEMPAEQAACLHYWTDDEEVLVLLCFSPQPVSLTSFSHQAGGRRG